MIDAAGTYELRGVDALAFLRSREGVGDGSDLTRISSQQVYLSALVRKLKSEDTLGDPKKVYDLAKAALSKMQLSTSLA
jgi:anionic cell wall polymer biosynthesis LytR-Cps2A-Psr (LCP) family protein